MSDSRILSNQSTDRGATLEATVMERLVGPRRQFLRRTLGLGAGAAALSSGLFGGRRAEAAQVNDAAILNFALNLEYLEAEYYTYAVTGQGIEAFGVGVNGMGTLGPVIVPPNPTVPFESDLIRAYAEEIAEDERNHVRAIRQLLTSGGAAPVARPRINLVDSFNRAAAAAGLPTPFNPFANEINFLLGAFIFEDVGVTAYKGAAPLIRNRNVLSAAAGILAVEGYHAGNVRTVLAARGVTDPANAISDARDSLDGPVNLDQGLTINDGEINIVPADPNTSIAFGRTTTQVLQIVYLNPEATPLPDSFFPNGLNGPIR